METKTMTHRSVFAGFLIALAFALPPAAASGVESAQPGRIDVPDVPADLTVPEGHVVYLETRAHGTQNYICMPAPAGAAWKFLGPQATLFISTPAFQQQIATHFLSANPVEQDLPRPTWQHSFDSSSVWARVVQPSTDPNYVAPGAIPWLLLEAAGAAAGPHGGSLLSRTTYIHRVHTQGGVAPDTGCTDATQIGTVALVPYSTDYFFYRAKRR
jgi:hypothetical protein